MKTSFLKNSKLKKSIVTCALASVIMTSLTIAPAHFLGSSVAEAHYMTSMQEWKFGQKALEEYHRVYSDVMDGQESQLTYIEEQLVMTNHSKLQNYFDFHRDCGKTYKRTLDFPELSTEPSINSYSLPGGVTIVTNGMWKMIYHDQSYLDGDRLNHSFDENSEMAFVLGHEFGHFEKEHFLKKFDSETNWNVLLSVGSQNANAGYMTQELAQAGLNFIQKLMHRQNSLDNEYEADAESLEFSSNSQDYSAAGGIIFFNDLLKYENAHPFQDSWEYPHPDTINRRERVADFIKKQSGNRVTFSTDYEKAYLDNNEINISKSDRENIAWAGNIAKAIDLDVTHLMFAPYITISRPYNANNKDNDNLHYYYDSKEKTNVYGLHRNASNEMQGYILLGTIDGNYAHYDNLARKNNGEKVVIRYDDKTEATSTTAEQKNFEKVKELGIAINKDMKFNCVKEDNRDKISTINASYDLAKDNHLSHTKLKNQKDN